MTGVRKLVSMLAVLVLAAGLAGCEEQSLYAGLTEQEANEMVALMQRSGIPASKIAGKDDAFAVATEADHFADAVELLQANGLPRPSFDSLGKVFQAEGFVTSSTAQRARYIHALSQEISHTISSIDGVILARVHLAVPERDPLSDVKVQSSASVFVKHRADVDLSVHVSQIKALVINGLENLPYENVTVALFEALPQLSFQPIPVMVTPPAAVSNETVKAVGQTQVQGITQHEKGHALANKMSFLPAALLSSATLSSMGPLGLIITGLVVLSFVMVGLLWSIWSRAKTHSRSSAP